jgi:pyridoxine kinase
MYMNEKVLLINDIPGYGKVALAAMMPILAHMKYDVYNLPTAVVSNTLDYGKFDILETTEYMKKTLKVWDELGFSFDAITTGFIVSQEQADIVTRFCREQASRGVRIFVDPIMGDEGHLYNGVGEETVERMRDLCRIADYIMPNYTEAAYLAGLDCKDGDLDEGETRQLIDALRAICPRSVLITSVRTDGTYVVLGYDHERNTYFQLPYNLIPVRFPGTGDAFSAILTGQVLRGHALETAALLSMESVRNLIAANMGVKDIYKGIPIEQCLNLVEEVQTD